MSGLDNMRTRINYTGGANQQDRMIEDKLRSLKKAMLYSYQAATAILEDGREFRCLINPDTNRTDYRDKIISIPFSDIRVGDTIETIDELTGETIRTSVPNIPGGEKTTSGIESIGMKIGDIFEWKEDKTYWLVYLRYEEERAYFRAEIRNCDAEIEINGKKYRGYMRGPDEDDTLWKTKHKISWVDLDYSALLYITSNEETRSYFKRFKKLEIFGKPWEVQLTDPISNEGLLMIALKEAYSNDLDDTYYDETFEQYGSNEQTPEVPESEEIENIQIVGPQIVYPYDRKKYTIQNAEGGIWHIDNEKKAIITHQSQVAATVEFITGRSGEVKLSYTRDGEEDVVINITIASL